VLVRRLVALLTLLFLVGVSTWFGRMPLLRGAADVWIVSDPVVPSDAVAVFGGGVADRPFAAAAYYRDGLVQKVLISDNRTSPAAELGAVPSDSDANYRVLRRLGVPDGAIEFFGKGSASTHDEVLALREWAGRAGVRSIIVPTEIFSTRRVRWTLHHVFGHEFAIIVPALDPPEYRRDDWWRNAQGLITFQNEVLKYVYYRMAY
jgi:uncharacterized SAM-binding protein YcdF (DUF218 family)